MKKLAITAAILITGAAAVKLYLDVHAQIIVDRFPDLPEKEVRKAYSEIMISALRGELNDVDTDNEEQMDALLRQRVKENAASAK
jgi:hypothetical protein